MKPLRFSLIAALCTLSLTACVSSSGGGESNSSLFITKNPYSVNVPPSSEGDESVFSATSLLASNNPTQLSGGSLRVTPNGAVSSNIQNRQDESLEGLIIGDTLVALFNVYDLLSEEHLNTFKPLTEKDVKEGKPSGEVSGYIGGFGNSLTHTGFYNTRFGVYRAEGVDNLFVQGYVTPLTETVKSRNGDLNPMPTQGRYTYTNGQGLYGKDGVYEQLKASVIADFDNDKLSVSLSDNISSNPKVTFSSNISGNGFSGSSAGIHSKGQFYGDNADEVAGIFYQTEGTDKGKSGVFGARSPRRDSGQ